MWARADMIKKGGINDQRIVLMVHTFSQAVDLEGRSLLGEDGLGQVQNGRVVDGEVAVVVVQHPGGRSLNTAGPQNNIKAPSQLRGGGSGVKHETHKSKEAQWRERHNAQLSGNVSGYGCFM